jgi:hypothetical protein
MPAEFSEKVMENKEAADCLIPVRSALCLQEVD